MVRVLYKFVVLYEQVVVGGVEEILCKKYDTGIIQVRGTV